MSYQSPFHMRMRDITNQKIKDEEKKGHHIKNQEDRVVNQTTNHSIPDMRTAYAKVMNSDYEPNDGEIAYRQFSTSGFVKH